MQLRGAFSGGPASLGGSKGLTAEAPGAQVLLVCSLFQIPFAIVFLDNDCSWSGSEIWNLVVDCWHVPLKPTPQNPNPYSLAPNP